MDVKIIKEILENLFFVIENTVMIDAEAAARVIGLCARLLAEIDSQVFSRALCAFIDELG